MGILTETPQGSDFVVSPNTNKSAVILKLSCLTIAENVKVLDQIIKWDVVQNEDENHLFAEAPETPDIGKIKQTVQNQSHWRH